MLMLCSARDSSRVVSAPESVLRGLAPDGGLFVPVRIPRIGIEGLLDADYCTIARKVFSAFLPGYSPEAIERSILGAYDGKFACPEITPVVPAGDRYVLELFRGPTAAFKDIALSALPRLMSEARANDTDGRGILVVTATSGDTGSAALNGFRDVPGTGIIVFYPEYGISEVQRLQMTAAQGANISVCAVRGNFDDAQRGVKQAFTRIGDGMRLSSANSINYGRLVPQIVYYYAAYLSLVRLGAVRPGEKVNFSVPTGNFGDILAGWYAKESGLPVGRLLCASNANDVLTAMIRDGRYDRMRKFRTTLSPSMDILVSSNFERLLFHLTDGDSVCVSSLMRSLAEQGSYTMPAEAFGRLRESFLGVSVGDGETKDTIRSVFRGTGYLLDPHTAVAWRAADEVREENGAPWVVLATASPYKFAGTVLDALGEPVPGDGRRQLEALRTLTGKEIPAPLSAALERPVRFRDSVDRDGIEAAIRKAGELL